MPRFSANLGFLWPDRPLLERIEAAGRAGFKAVEVHWPYEIPAETVAGACRRAGVKLLGMNTEPGDAAGEFGMGTQAGREDAFLASVEQAVGYARATGAWSIHVLAGVVEPDAKAEASRIFVRNLKAAAELA